MPIQPPNFSVSPISPAALLQQRDRRAPLEGLLGQILGIGIQARFASEQAEAAHERRLELEERAEEFTLERDAARAAEQFESLVAQGAVRRVPEGGFPSLPGESLERVPTPEGVEGEYVRTRDVTLASPFEQYLGRRTREGTRTRDVIDPITGQVSPARAAGVAEGDAEMIREMISQIPMASVRDAALAQLEAAERDEFVSLAEEQEILDRGISLPQIANYHEVVRRISEMERDRRAQIGRARLEAGQSYQVVTGSPDGPQRRRPLYPVERDLIALDATGNRDIMTEEQRAALDALYGRGPGQIARLVPSAQPIDIQAELRSSLTNSGNPGNDEFESFVTWMQGHVQGRDGSVINEAVASDIRDVTGLQMGDDALREFANSSLSAPYRAAYALYTQGYGTAGAVDELNNLGTVFPFDFEQAREVFGKIYPDEGFSPTRQSRPAPSGRAPIGGESEQTQASSQSAFQSIREPLSQDLSTAPDEVLNFTRETLMLGSPTQVVDSLRSTVEHYRQRADSMNISEGERRTAEGLVNYFRDVVELAENDPEGFTFWRDSIFIPAIDTARVRRNR